MSDYHRPVMLSEVLEFLQPENGETIVDCTVGGGGHTLEIVKLVAPDGRVIGVYRDDEALSAARERTKEFSDSVLLEKGNFSELEEIADRLGLSAIDGALMDLGVSSHQLDAGERGFSFKADAPLDMRMDPTQGETAADIVNTRSERELTEILWNYGEERWAKRVAKFIVERRGSGRITTTSDLVDIVLAAIPAGARPEKIHPATRTFQALRIVANRELESLQAGLDSVIRLLSTGGRVCVLSYHSLEDRIVKETFLRYSGRCSCPPSLPICACGAKRTVRILTRKPVTASESEVRENPRSRSARLRVAEKL